MEWVWFRLLAAPDPLSLPWMPNTWRLTMDFNLATMLVETARREPGKDAVIFDDVRISYAQLDALSDRVAAN